MSKFVFFLKKLVEYSVYITATISVIKFAIEMFENIGVIKNDTKNIDNGN
jgi:hypothetical protein